MAAFFFFAFLPKKPSQAKKWFLMESEAPQEMPKQLKGRSQSAPANWVGISKLSVDSECPLHLKLLLTKISPFFFKLEGQTVIYIVSYLFLWRLWQWWGSILFCCRYEDAFNRFIDEINSIASYDWWEGSVHRILSVLAYPCAWSWKQWRRRIKIQRLQEYVKSEYDHSCLRSCRSRALYKGMKVSVFSPE